MNKRLSTLNLDLCAVSNCESIQKVTELHGNTFIY